MSCISGEPRWRLMPADKSAGRTFFICIVAIVILLAVPRLAWSDSSSDAAIKYDFDDPPDTDNRLTEHLTFGSQVTFSFEYERDYDLDEDEDEDLASFEPELEVAFSYDPAPWFRAFANLDLKRQFPIEEPDGRDSQETRLRVKQAYVNLREIFQGVSVTLGRQEFKDEREWLYDEDLDGVRLFYRDTDFGIEASVSREKLVDKDILNEDSGDEINNYSLLARYALGEDSEISPYLFLRDERSSSDEDLIFLGVSSTGELASDFDYWAEFALVRGSDEGTDIRGYGFDVGATYVFDSDFEPSLTLGAAFGSGDSDPDDTDRNFRQSGLQDNSDRFNGITSFKYYGEVLDPELSNLFILTAGVGVRPTKDTSIDLIYHHYRQHRASDELRDAAIDEDPNGNDRNLGNGLDLIIGFREIENVSAEAVFGLFDPGDAFSSDASTAYFVGFEVEFSF